MARTLRWDDSGRQEVHQDGFSLSEMMAVIGIMTIMLAAALPAFSAWRENAALQNASQTLMAHLKQARLMAVSGNRTVHVVFTSGGYTLDSGGTKQQQFALSRYSDALVFSDVTFTSNKLTFSAHGTANSGHVTMQNAGGATHKITINILGRAYD